MRSPLAVTISGLRPGLGLHVVFNRVPKNGAFGRPMGTFYADKRGTIRFIYPRFLYKGELGLWEMTGYRANGSVALRFVFQVVR